MDAGSSVSALASSSYRGSGLVLEGEAKDRFKLEQLETRIMLSATQPAAPITPEVLSAASVELIHDRGTFEGASVDLDTASEIQMPSLFDEDPESPAPIADPLEMEQTPAPGAEELVENAAVEAAEENLYPILPRLELDVLSHGKIAGQVFLLSFDGGEAVDYRGPVSITGVPNVHFEVPEELRPLVTREEVIAQITDRVQSLFDGSGVAFIAAPTRAGPGEVSTIFIGGDDTAFHPYGRFFGISETVDRGNLFANDNGWVFASSIFQSGVSVETYVDMLVETVAHEAGRL
ncbi:MAG TPA: hypothetical protein VF614_15490, partial [Chthoniobacteraceae bacterium]